jgi:hypothetical protein
MGRAEHEAMLMQESKVDEDLFLKEIGQANLA